MDERLELVVAPDMRSEAMSLAHQIREEEGVDMGTALEEAWAQLRGEEWEDELPYEEEEEDFVEVRPRRRASPESEGFGGIGLLVLLGLGGWLAYYYWKNKRFPWQPIVRPMPRVNSSRLVMPGEEFGVQVSVT